jgi:hypothetical protein
VNASDQIWLQGSPVLRANSELNVHLGLENTTDERFELLILSAPKGTLEKDVAFKTADIDKLGVELLASHIVHRTN